jgi:hypothetical protein
MKHFAAQFIACAWLRAGYPLLHADHVWRVSPRDLLLSPLLERIE